MKQMNNGIFLNILQFWITDLGCASAARAEATHLLPSHLISMHLLCSTRRGPRLNLFFLIAHNCSLDVYFLISSDIAGAW